MNTVHVYRVESPTGKGPYTHPYKSDALRKALADHEGDPTRPSPFMAGEPWDRNSPGYQPYDQIFGFLYMEDLERWFSNAMPYLKGFCITTYEVDDDSVLLGSSGQVAFFKSDSVQISRKYIW